MGRVLCLDYGRKRVGIAVTDPLRIIASGLVTVPTHTIRDYLKTYLAGGEVDRVVIGYPKTVRNEPSEAVRYIDPFITWFRKEFPAIPVDLFDERFTSRMAGRSLLEAGVSKSRRKDKSLVDMVSASLILQSYLDADANRRSDMRN
jgi:putative Holliday junction resolvase